MSSPGKPKGGMNSPKPMLKHYSSRRRKESKGGIKASYRAHDPVEIGPEKEARRGENREGEPKC